jgi:hypothetical protein
MWLQVPEWARHQDILTVCQSQSNFDLGNLRCLHPVARVISYDVGFDPSTQRDVV